MIIKLNSISNPGISFTEDVNLKLISLYKFIEKNENREVQYSDFQDELINEKIFSGSYIRSFIPFMKNFGIINDYSKIKYNNFFTDIGKMYIENLMNYYNLENSSTNGILKYLKKNKEYLICLFLDNLCKNKHKYYDKYLDILYLVKKFNKICRNEFYIYEYCKENNISCDELIIKYRENPETFEIKFINKNNNEISNNAFNYFIALLSEEQCNYVYKIDQNYYKLNDSKKDSIDLIIEQYVNYGG